MGEASSYSSGNTDKPLLTLTIGELFDDVAMRLPEHDALVSRHEELRLTYARLREEVDELALAFIGFGVQKGDRVGIWSPNNFGWVATQFASAKIGAILVNINPAYRVQELEYALNQSGVSLLITARQFKSSDYHSMLYELIPELRDQGNRPEVSSNRIPTLRKVVTLDNHANRGIVSWSDFIETNRAKANLSELTQRAGALDFRDPINIQYTSGTTGLPKGATLTHYSILNNGFFVGEGMKFTEKDRLCIPVPFYHCFGMVLGNLACITHGATMILPSDSFNAESVLTTVQEERCTALHGVPTMFIAELEHPKLDSFDLSSLRTGIMAGSPCPIEVMRKVISKMGIHDITICYGMTETSPVSFQTLIDDPLELRVTTVGKVLPHVEAKVIDPLTGSVVPHGSSGELCVRGYLVMREYWNNSDATREAVDNEKWMHTGDLAMMNADGYLNIVGRTKDMISRGGEKIFPKEVEDFLYTHPKVSDVQVIGVPSSKYGEVVMAWIKLKPGTIATADELREYCKDKIAYFKIPAYFKFTDVFPMTVTGKIQKFKMREISTRELGLDAAATVRTA